MSQILGIKFTDYGQVYYFSSGPFVVREGQNVIVKTDQGMGLGKVVLTRQAPREDETGEGHKAIYRLANDKDMEAVTENRELSRAAFKFCRKCIERLGLGMKLVDVEVFFDRSKMVFFFTAPGRIDFRELIKDLVREYRTRIELRQIGVRHETQMLGAIGNCGQLCCCRRFMRKFVPVTIKMAKEQNLFLNPTKISGICGRLLCCLSFEQESYEEFHRQSPKVGKKYTTSLGRVKVLRSNLFKKNITLLVEGNEEREVSVDEWAEIVNKPPSEEALERGARPARSRGGRASSKPARSTSAASKPAPRTPSDSSTKEESAPRPKPRSRQDQGAQAEDAKDAGKASAKETSGRSGKSSRRPRRRRRPSKK